MAYREPSQPEVAIDRTSGDRCLTFTQPAPITVHGFVFYFLLRRRRRKQT